MIKTVCVYCGASARVTSEYQKIAERLGEVIACAGFDMVYGAGKLGLMGVTAQSALRHGAHVVGVTPKLLEDYEGTLTGLSELYVVDSMHTRKQKMFDMADAFVILPGGFGTLDEVFEMITWRQLKIHEKPIVFVNAFGYWDHLQRLIHHMVKERFVSPNDAQFISFVDSPDGVVVLLNEQERVSATFQEEHHP